MADRRKSTTCSSTDIKRIELALATVIGKEKYTREVNRSDERGIYNLGGEKVHFKLSDDDKTLLVSLDGDKFKPLSKFLPEQAERYKKNGEPPMSMVQKKAEEEEDTTMTCSWYDIKKAEEDELVVNGNCCVGARQIRNGTLILPLESSFWDTFFTLSLVIAKASVGAD